MKVSGIRQIFVVNEPGSPYSDTVYLLLGGYKVIRGWQEKEQGEKYIWEWQEVVLPDAEML